MKVKAKIKINVNVKTLTTEYKEHAEENRFAFDIFRVFCVFRG